MEHRYFLPYKNINNTLNLFKIKPHIENNVGGYNCTIMGRRLHFLDTLFKV